MKESAAERIERMKREKEAAQNNDLIGQLTHDDTSDKASFSELAKKLKERKEQEKTSVLKGTVKYCVYVDADVAEAFDALCLKRGDQKVYCNQALRDFVEKKARELSL